jgi:hypothetical protein
MHRVLRQRRAVPRESRSAAETEFKVLALELRLFVGAFGARPVDRDDWLRRRVTVAIDVRSRLCAELDWAEAAAVAREL